jgi:nitronate monooxygenase
MFLVSGPDLVWEACRAGLVGALPRQDARTLEQFADWLAAIHQDLEEYAAAHPDARIGPVAVNLAPG